MTTQKPLKLACIGCGARAQTYTQLAARRPERFQIVAGADPVPERVEKIRRISGTPDFRGFPAAEAVLSAGKLADVIVVAGNPLEDLDALKQVQMAFVGGRRLV